MKIITENIQFVTPTHSVVSCSWWLFMFKPAYKLINWLMQLHHHDGRCLLLVIKKRQLSNVCSERLWLCDSTYSGLNTQRQKYLPAERLRHVLSLKTSACINTKPGLYIPDTSAPVVSVRGAAVQPERVVQAKPEVQVGPAQQNHDPRAQRTYTEELRREPITDKYVDHTHTSIFTYTHVMYSYSVTH